MLKGLGKGIAGENIRSGKRLGLSERDAVLSDMKRTKREAKAQMPSMASGPSEDYPYGLRLELDHGAMKKVGMTKMPKVGSVHKIVAHAKVHRAEETASVGSPKRRNVSMQIVKMAVQPGPNDQDGDEPPQTES